MKPRAVILCLLSFAFSACGGDGLMAAKRQMDVDVVNRLSRQIQNAQVRFGERVCEWGYVAPSGTAAFMFFPHPITPDAEMHWDEDGKHRVEKLDLRKIYPPGKSGRLTFTVHDGRVEVTFREKTPKP